MHSDFIALPAVPTWGDAPSEPPAGDTQGIAGAWHIWKGMVLRGAGFPFAMVDRLADTSLADAADRALASATQAGRPWPSADELSEYDATFSAAVGAASAAIVGIASQPLFREALTWQNPHFVRTCLDHLGGGTAERRSRQRKQESAIGGYIQRYTTKNDSIGFFGPVGWAQWAPGDCASSLIVGPRLLRRRMVYFESWAIDEVAATLAGRPELRHGVPPRRSPANLLDGRRVVRPDGSAESLSAEWEQILRRCDGTRPVRGIAAVLGYGEDWLISQLALMCKSGLVRMDLDGPLEPRPELRLAQRLASVPDPQARQAALADLERLVGAKDEVASAAGDPGRLAAALDVLAARFETITGRSSVHQPGQAYAGRTIAYEDCIRDVRVDVGSDVLDSLGAPLTLVLHSARWLAASVGELYLRRLDEHYERIRKRAGTDSVPLGRLLAAMTREFYVGDGTPPLANGAVRELQQRWARILAIPDGARRHQVEPGQIAAAVAAEFSSPTPQWSGGMCHSPDVLIDTDSVEALNQGAYQLVLGELHTAHNTVVAVALAEQSEDKDRLRAMAEFATGADRIVVVPSRDWGFVTRTRPLPDLMSPGHVYWTAAADDVAEVPADVIPAGALEVTRVGDDLIVVCRTDQRTFPLAEVIGDYLSQVVVSSFRMLPPHSHNPRVSIGRLVVSRETWRLAPRFCDWARQLDEPQRFLRMRGWVAKLGLPRRVFCVLPGEGKPVYVDFASVPLMNNLASLLRKIDRDDPAHVTFSEMLPGPDGCWLKDAEGNSFVSELRLVVSERADP